MQYTYGQGLGMLRPKITPTKRNKMLEAVGNGLFSDKIGDFCYPHLTRGEFRLIMRAGMDDIDAGIESEYATIVHEIRYAQAVHEIEPIASVRKRDPKAYLAMRDPSYYGLDAQMKAIYEELKADIQKLNAKESK